MLSEAGQDSQITVVHSTVTCYGAFAVLPGVPDNRRSMTTSHEIWSTLEGEYALTDSQESQRHAQCRRRRTT